MQITRSHRARYATHIRFVTREEAGPLMDFEGKKAEIAVRYEAGTTVLYCGLGEEGRCGIQVMRSASAEAARKCIALKRGQVSLLVPEKGAGGEAASAACLEGVLLGAYGFDKYKTEKPCRIEALELVGAQMAPRRLKAVQASCESVWYARDLVNENASVVYPETLAQDAHRIGAQGTIKVTVLPENRIEEEKLGLLHAVGQGSAFPPRLIVMEYGAAPGTKVCTALVGKGITFDSGGQNLKPTDGIETMRTDMAGAAAVLGTMRALSVMGPRLNVVGVVPAAQNALGRRAYFPGDVHTSYSGKTVEICNTDAEGRLVLADALSYCLKNYQPTRLVDIATLTGGIRVALGETVAGLFSNDDALAEALFASGEAVFERLWRFPLYPEYSEAMRSDRADLRNTAKLKKAAASSLTGAAFLKEFVEGMPWAHIDIAGTAYNEAEPRGEVPRGATGFGVRLLLKFLGVL